jgi:hypothetical protein
MNPLREEREYAIRELARQERDAWTALERAGHSDEADEAIVRAYRTRWHEAAHALVTALRSLKH